MIKLIGLAGPARCGKSSAAGFLSELMGYEQYALAAPIKSLVNALFDWNEEHSEGLLKETLTEVGVYRKDFFEEWERLNMSELLGIESGPAQFGDMLDTFFIGRDSEDAPWISPRRAYQLFGTEYARGIKPTIWLDLAKAKLAEVDGLIITDIRFPNEHQWITQNAGFLVHVRRSGSQYNIRSTGHASEAGLKTMAMDWQTLFCDNLEQLEYSMVKVADFARCANTSDVALSGRIPTFVQVYGDAANG